jgi:cyclopropane-fatty-acyl-phospholipid synthase
MAREFFSGGMMPSSDLLPKAAKGIFVLKNQWYVNGLEYTRTLHAWLKRHDANVKHIEAIFTGTHSSSPAIVARRWRLFYMACEELFAFNGGREWGVSHYLFSTDSSSA